MAIELEDGTVVRSLPEQVDYLTTHNEENEIAIDNLAARLEAAIAGVLHYKGSVATYADLPADAEIGDVYNVIDTGANYAWTGSEWDELGSVIDTSNLVDLISNQTITGKKTVKAEMDFLSQNETYRTRIVQNDNGSLYIYGAFTDNPAAIFDDVNVYLKKVVPMSSSEDLGTSSAKWYDIWLSNAVHLGNTWSIVDYEGELAFDRYGELKYMVGTSSFFPNYNNQNDLGKDGQRWKDFYLAGEIDLQAQKRVKFTLPNSNVYAIGSNQYNYLQIDYNGAGMYSIATSAIFPNSSNSRDLGTNTLTWRDLFLGRNLTDGTNSVTVADLAALIAYAKAQGWIS